MPEISEEDFQANVKLRQTVAALLGNPKARELVLKAQKEAFPNTPIPEIDSKAPVEAAITELKKTVTDFIDGQKAEQAESLKNRQLDALNTRFANGQKNLKDAGWTDDGMKAVEKIMEERGILDHADAAAIFEKENPQATPVVSNGFGGYNFFDTPKDGGEDKNLAKLIESKGEDTGALTSLVNTALAESRGQVRR